MSSWMETTVKGAAVAVAAAFAVKREGSGWKRPC